ncbi:MAG: class I SAM-dependent methyltransferase [Candidatus Odinarchaeota archaeon]
MNKEVPYDEKYAKDDYYWGKEPTAICKKVIEYSNRGAENHQVLLELGCGEGRDAVHFARHGFNVTALDISSQGLKKLEKYAAEIGVEIKTIQANMINYRLSTIYDIIFSSGAVHYIPPELREEHFRHYKEQTRFGGIHAHVVLLDKPFIARAPDAEPDEIFFTSGEIMKYYSDWEIVFIDEEIIDCNSSGIPHKHVLNTIIAKKPASKVIG